MTAAHYAKDFFEPSSFCRHSRRQSKFGVSTSGGISRNGKTLSIYGYRHNEEAKLRALDELINRQVGHLILVNIKQGMTEGMLDAVLVLEFINRLDSRIASLHTATDAEFLFEVRHAVWDDASRFQLQGPDCTESQSQVVVLKSYSDITTLVNEVTDIDLHQQLRDLTSKPYDTVTDDECEEIATLLSNLDAFGEQLHLSMTVGGRHRVIVWATRLEELQGIGLRTPPNNAIASRLRDQLGLGHYRRRYPMFAFISALGYDELIVSGGQRPKRPTAFDAINHPWFKHRRDRYYPSDNWGRATDLEKVELSSGDELDGGPETVSSSFRISGNFQCVFIGRPISNAPEPDPELVRRISPGMDAAAIVRYLETQLG
jgi:hypothetical protein